MYESLPRHTVDKPGKNVVSSHSQGAAVQATPTSETLVVSCVEDVTEFAALQTEWDALQVNNDRTSVFMSWAWHFTWWSVFGGDDSQRLCILCVRLRHQLVAVLPMYSRTRRWPRPTLLMFLGSGEGEADEVATGVPRYFSQPRSRRTCH